MGFKSFELFLCLACFFLIDYQLLINSSASSLFILQIPKQLIIFILHIAILKLHSFFNSLQLYFSLVKSEFFIFIWSQNKLFLFNGFVLFLECRYFGLYLCQFGLYTFGLIYNSLIITSKFLTPSLVRMEITLYKINLIIRLFTILLNNFLAILLYIKFNPHILSLQILNLFSNLFNLTDQLFFLLLLYYLLKLLFQFLNIILQIRYHLFTIFYTTLSQYW